MMRRVLLSFTCALSAGLRVGPVALSRHNARMGAVTSRLRGGNVGMSGAAVVEEAAPVEKFRKDYAPPPYAIAEVELDFALGDGATDDERATTVRSRLHVRRRADAGAGADLALDGEDLELVSVSVDGQALAAGAADGYALAADGALTIRGAALRAECVVECVVRLAPAANLQLSGLYKSSGMFCTQCEAEGFRRITCAPRSRAASLDGVLRGLSLPSQILRIGER